MWEKLRIVFTIPELRQKILLTMFFLAIYRVGSWIPLPFVDQAQMQKVFAGEGGLARLLDQVATFSASQLDQMTIFGLGIMPYISASIIFQLLASVWHPLEQLQKEGETGRKKINEYTRYATVVICLLQSWIYVSVLNDPEQGYIRPEFVNSNGGLRWDWYFVGILTMTAGTVFLMWLGEQIDEYGIGNGISLLIMAGILARLPRATMDLVKPITSGSMELTGDQGVDRLILLAALFAAVIVGVVFITQGQRRIPTQSAKHVRGRRVYGGTRQYLPLRVNQSGVMPIIFASSLLMFPALGFAQLEQLVPQTPGWQWFHDLSRSIASPQSFVHNVLYIILIYFFCYFWTAITFNPKDMSENLKSMGTFIPGYRPGKRTADYLEKVMVRITYVGAGFLALVAIMPTLVSSSLTTNEQIAQLYGGTSILIAVSVAFDLVQKIDSHLVMRNYRGLLE